MTYKEFIEESKSKLNNYQFSENIINSLIFLHNKNIKDILSLTDFYNIDINNDIANKIKTNISELNDGKPLVRILGYTWFLGYKFDVFNNVLIPRPETEYITEIIIEKLSSNPNLKVLDLCCGSGVIGLSIKKQLTNIELTLSDIDDEAIANTKQNMEHLNINANVIQSDLFSNLQDTQFNVIVSNPPYISKNFELDTSVVKYDPELALYAENNGLSFYESICSQLKDHLTNKYFLAFEIGFDQSKQVQDIIYKYLNVKSELIKDQYNCDRLIIVDRL
ncbi:MAG: peptide chain release factor N(5)-glutamine methyltransferase [Mycoplasma sp.]